MTNPFNGTYVRIPTRRTIMQRQTPGYSYTGIADRRYTDMRVHQYDPRESLNRINRFFAL